MKFSEALRLGSMAVPSMRGPVWTYDGDRFCGACAIGSALIAVGAFDIETHQLRQGEKEIWPILSAHAKHPVDGLTNWVYGIVISLFETYRWTLPQIADQVELWEQEFERAATVNVEPRQASEQGQPDGDVLVVARPDR